jgi:shikimate dehydrogenase
MKQFGLIGFPLKNSFSENYFNTKFSAQGLTDHVYQNFALQSIDELPQLLASQPNLIGFNVTIPHKQSILKYIDKLDETALAVGAVNCVKLDRSTGTTKLIGYNTDVYGFEESLRPLLKDKDIKQALILGTGGAAKAVAYVLGKLNIKFLHVGRISSETKLGYEDLSEGIIHQHTLIVNCTPLGMFPNVNDAPDIPYQAITAGHLVYDLIYMPEETLFLKQSKFNGALIKNGLEMLHLQAEKSWTIWTDRVE